MSNPSERIDYELSQADINARLEAMAAARPAVDLAEAEAELASERFVSFSTLVPRTGAERYFAEAKASDPHPWDTISLANLPDTAPPEATLMRRTDGVGLLYPGVRNLLFAPFESSKTFVSLLACQQVLVRGGSVLYIDFESSARAIRSRLRQMGVTDQELEGFGYIRPTLPVDNDRLERALDRLNPELVVIDACAEAMVTHDLDENSNGDFMKFSRLMLEPLEARGHAVLLLDHMGKAAGEEGKKYPRGASAKMATISGCALRIEVETPFRRGHNDGLARVYVAKDREGAVRQYSTAETLVAYLHLMTVDGKLHVELDPPAGPAQPIVQRDEFIAQRAARLGQREWQRTFDGKEEVYR